MAAGGPDAALLGAPTDPQDRDDALMPTRHAQPKKHDMPQFHESFGDVTVAQCTPGHDMLTTTPQVDPPALWIHLAGTNCDPKPTTPWAH